VVSNSGWTPLTCAAEAKKNGGSLFAIQVGMWALCPSLGRPHTKKIARVVRHCSASWCPLHARFAAAHIT
jgi:hypothetical protein